MPSASSVEPVLAISLCNTLACAACHAKSDGTKGSAAISLAAGANTCPASPPSGCSAPLMLMICCCPASPATPSSAMRTAMAAPAEWPIKSAGRLSTTSSNWPIAWAMPGSDRSGELAPPGGRSVNAWPGKSSDSTLKCGVSRGTRPRQECVDAPVPCSSSAVGADSC